MGEELPEDNYGSLFGPRLVHSCPHSHPLSIKIYQVSVCYVLGASGSPGIHIFATMTSYPSGGFSPTKLRSLGARQIQH